MNILRAVVVGGAVTLLCLSGSAAEPAAEMKTLLSERGKLLFADDFTQPLGSDWRTSMGRWEIVDGVLKSSQLKTETSGPKTVHMMPFRNVIIQYSFKLEGARITMLSMNDAKGHCCQLMIFPSSIAIQKGTHDHNKADKMEILDSRKVAIKRGEWHTIVLEIHGREVLASLDGGVIAFSAHDCIDVAKVNFYLTVGGESASFRNLRVWEALPNKSWDTTKTKLLQERANSGGQEFHQRER